MLWHRKDVRLTPPLSSPILHSLLIASFCSPLNSTDYSHKTKVCMERQTHPLASWHSLTLHSLVHSLSSHRLLLPCLLALTRSLIIFASSSIVIWFLALTHPPLTRSLLIFTLSLTVVSQSVATKHKNR